MVFRASSRGAVRGSADGQAGGGPLAGLAVGGLVTAGVERAAAGPGERAEGRVGAKAAGAGRANAAGGTGAGAAGGWARSPYSTLPGNSRTPTESGRCGPEHAVITRATAMATANPARRRLIATTPAASRSPAP